MGEVPSRTTVFLRVCRGGPVAFLYSLCLCSLRFRSFYEKQSCTWLFWLGCVELAERVAPLYVSPRRRICERSWKWNGCSEGPLWRYCERACALEKMYTSTISPIAAPALDTCSMSLSEYFVCGWLFWLSRNWSFCGLKTKSSSSSLFLTCNAAPSLLEFSLRQHDTAHGYVVIFNIANRVRSMRRSGIVDVKIDT